ncbi:MAG TPA: hypothetical protein VMU58_07810 [Gaiellaceae bacterium]|nr:hypothetical protein [Gaiellaceae bacterium]
MRLRRTLILVLIIAAVALVGAWTDRTQVAVDAGSGAVPAAKPWNTIVEISRHGRRLDGFRPVLTISGLGAPKTFHGNEVSSGRYRVQVIFPHPGFFTYTVTVADRVASRGTVYAIPR